MHRSETLPWWACGQAFAGVSVENGSLFTGLVFTKPRRAFARNASAGRHLAVEHWGEAMEMGTIAGATAAGSERRWDQAPGFFSAIGQRTLKYAAWGDGYEQTRFDDHGDGFTVWYFAAGRVVGVLTHDAEQDYERGRDLVESSAAATEA